MANPDQKTILIDNSYLKIKNICINLQEDTDASNLEVNSLLKGLNSSNKVLYSILKEVERNKNKIGPISHGSKTHTDIMKTQSLKQALNKFKFDAAFGGARRDEEKSRAKERIFSFRDTNHRWDPKNQKPELWNLFNTKISKDESVRIFPLSNWTEVDVWQYIYQENIPIVPLYFAAKRPVIKRDNMLIMVDDDRLEINKNEKVEEKLVRFRTLGCYPLTVAIESKASNIEQIIIELLESNNSERQGRLIDSDQIGSMEIKKQDGYF